MARTGFRALNPLPISQAEEALAPDLLPPTYASIVKLSGAAKVRCYTFK